LSQWIICDSLCGTRIANVGCSMWKPEHRRTADHRGLRYPSDLTDAEWALVEPMIPPAKQSAKAAQKGVDPQGFGAGKKVTGRKRHILVDTLGLLLNVVVRPCAGSRRRPAGPRSAHPTSIPLHRTDAGYQGPKTAAAIAKTGSWRLEIVKRNDPHRFVVLPKRWIVERTLAWISHNRRLARDFERYARSAAAFVRLAMIRIMLKRLTRSAHCS
jgi:transposase